MRAALCSAALMNTQVEKQQSPSRRNDDRLGDVTPSFQAAQGQPKEDDMSAVTFTHSDIQTVAKPYSISQPTRTKAQAAGAVTGLAGGMTAALLGSLLTLAGWLVANDGASHWLTTTGSVLLFLTIPLIVLGACCLDWVEKNKSQRGAKTNRDNDEDDEH